MEERASVSWCGLYLTSSRPAWKVSPSLLLYPPSHACTTQCPLMNPPWIGSPPAFWSMPRDARALTGAELRTGSWV